MAIQDDFEVRFPTIPWVESVASSWTAYTCLKYSDKTKEAILNLIAHLLTLAARPGGGSSSSRNVASKSVGSVSVSYEASSSTGGNQAAWFGTTGYGQVFWMLTGRRQGAVFV